MEVAQHLVRRRHVRVRPHHRAHPAIGVQPDRRLLARGLTMKVEDEEVRLFVELLEERVEAAERAVQRRRTRSLSGSSPAKYSPSVRACAAAISARNSPIACLTRPSSGSRARVLRLERKPRRCARW